VVVAELAARVVVVEPGRADQVVAALWAISRGTAQRLLHDGRITLAGKRLRTGDRIDVGKELALQGDRNWFVQNALPVSQLALTADFVVVDKPAGLPSHALQPGEPSLVGAVVAVHADVGTAGPIPDGGLLHRLDNGTTGCVVLARSQAARQRGQTAWPQVRKEYLAVVEGHCQTQTIDAPLEHSGQRMRTAAAGLAATTTVQVLATVADHSVVHLLLTGGRHHQLRAHLASVGHPLVGDELYGSASPGAWLLHAWRLSSAAMAIAVEAPLPLLWAPYAECTRHQMDRNHHQW
jgi:23S rRNA pseudouridine1911/1915/1917 synthase